MTLTESGVPKTVVARWLVLGLLRNPDCALNGWYEVFVQPLPNQPEASNATPSNTLLPNTVATPSSVEDTGWMNMSGLVATQPSSWRCGDPVQEAQSLATTKNGVVILRSRTQSTWLQRLVISP